jgi:hypothetical protein
MTPSRTSFGQLFESHGVNAQNGTEGLANMG